MCGHCIVDAELMPRHRHAWLTHSSAKAYREGVWPLREWGVFDRDGEPVKLGFATRREACEWRDANEPTE